MSGTRYVMVADFDGTAAAVDVQQVILDALADREGWRRINAAWAVGEMTTAQRARAQWALIKGGEREVAAVLEPLRLDSGFAAFAGLCEARGFPLYIVSDGFDFYIEPLLQRAGLGHLPTIANSLRYEHDVPRMEFLLQRSPDQYYGNDKTFVIEQVREPDSIVVFIGDGYSDRAAAHAADLIFAKDRLAEYCREQDLQFEPFNTFEDISAYFARR
ncbi:MAG TPA: MtnX-like HAD-IB family phosphatase [Chloroflexota bacterium]|nr:MtnX-like HAD-IB family phosphatase [Chloroflexota bacterium]